MPTRTCDSCRAGRLVAALALLALGSGCDQGNSTQAQSQAKAAPPTVAVRQPLVREIVEWDEYTGRFDAVETVEVRARVSGYLTEVHFKDGQAVRQGNLLFFIDPRPLARNLAQSQAGLVAAETKMATTHFDEE